MGQYVTKTRLGTKHSNIGENLFTAYFSSSCSNPWKISEQFIITEGKDFSFSVPRYGKFCHLKVLSGFRINSAYSSSVLCICILYTFASTWLAPVYFEAVANTICILQNIFAKLQFFPDYFFHICS